MQSGWASWSKTRKSHKCCMSLWGFETRLYVYLYTYIRVCVYTYTNVGMGLPCGPMQVSVVSVYQCAVWYFPFVVSWHEINPLIFPCRLIFPGQLDTARDKKPHLAFPCPPILILSEDRGPRRRSLLPSSVSSRNSVPDPHIWARAQTPHIGQVQSLRVVGHGRNGLVPQLPKRANWQYSRSHQGYLGHQPAAKNG